jgi:hypothetical protein
MAAKLAKYVTKKSIIDISVNIKMKLKGLLSKY